jgi:DNA-directed RNA polymerase specialized sigma24 family protein
MFTATGYTGLQRLVPTADGAFELVQDTIFREARSPNAVPVGARNDEAWLVRVLVNIRRDQWRYTSMLDPFNPITKTNGSKSASAGRQT